MGIRAEMSPVVSELLEDKITEITAKVTHEAEAIGVDYSVLARLVVGGRTDTIRKQAIKQMLDLEEKRLIASWNNQGELL